MTQDVELREYIRREWRDDRSWMAAGGAKERRTRMGLVDLVAFLMEKRLARRERCC